MSNAGETRSEVILVVDDNEANRLLAQSTLEDEGYRVVLAPGGAEGVEAFERVHPACVLLDVRMPEVDGFAACERIRSLHDGADTPILFLTALRDVDTFDRALRAGGDDFLTKPVRPTELVVRVQTALKLRRLRAELREHYDALKDQRDALLRVQLQKERLMAFVVHDLKNPVAALDLHAQFLLREKGLSEAARDSAAHIRVEARQLTRMISNLLDLSKADEGKLSPRLAEVRLAEVVEEILSELAITAAARGIALQCAIDVGSFVADEDLIRRTLANLVENAIRHAPSDSAVSVFAATKESATVLRVRDAGRGVPDAMRDKVFDPFLRLEGSEQVATRGGQGLGLAFCKQVVEAHQGRIWVEDACPGAAFCVSIPHAQP